MANKRKSRRKPLRQAIQTDSTSRLLRSQRTLPYNNMQALKFVRLVTDTCENSIQNVIDMAAQDIPSIINTCTLANQLKHNRTIRG